MYHGWHPVSVERHGIVHSASRYLRRDRIYASQPPRLVSTECPRRSRGVATTRLRNIHAARIHPVVHHAVFVGLEHPPLLATGTAHVPASATGLCVIHTSRRSASWARPVLAEYPRRGRGGGATRPHGISTSWPRRRRDSSADTTRRETLGAFSHAFHGFPRPRALYRVFTSENGILVADGSPAQSSFVRQA